MKKLALRHKIGDWVYYLTSLTFKEVSECVSPITEEISNSQVLSDMLQRSLTSNVDSIVTYIQTQRERFFNALVLAVYNGEPQWREVRIDYGDGENIMQEY